MAVRDDLIEALSDSIDRLNNGEQLEIILASYPDLANQLRPMLEAGLLFPRARFMPAEVNLAKDTIEPTIQQTIRTVFGGGWNSSLFGLLLVIAIGVGLLMAADQLNTLNNTVSLDVDAKVTATEISPTSTSTVDVTNTTGPTESNTVIPTVTADPADTDIFSAVPSTITNIPNTSLPTPTEVPSTAMVLPNLPGEALFIIQGPVEAVTTHTITIYDQTIEVLPDNPYSSGDADR